MIYRIQADLLSSYHLQDKRYYFAHLNCNQDDIGKS